MAKFLLSAFADEASDELSGQIAALKRNGLRLIEPRSVNGGIIDKSEDELQKIHTALESEGITLSALGSPIGKYKIEDDFEPYLDTFKKALRACKILNAERMRVFSFFTPQQSLAKHRDEVIRRMSVLCEMAEKEGVTLCHENESEIYGQNPAEVRDLLSSVAPLRGIFDAANYVMNDCDPLEGFEVTLPKLEYLHIKDARRDEKAMTPAGMGDGCYREVLKKVDETTDRTVILTIEPHLHIFSQYKSIDKHNLKTELTFDSSDKAFDCAVGAVKNMLSELGFTEREDKIWTK